MDKFVGDRPTSKTDGLILFKFLERVFLHNHLSPPESRLEDQQITDLVLQEFSHVEHVIKQVNSKNYISVWRSLFNHGKMNTSKEKPEFVAYRITPTKQYTKSTSDRFVLSEHDVIADYHSRGLEVPASLLSEVKGYAQG